MDYNNRRMSIDGSDVAASQTDLEVDTTNESMFRDPVWLQTNPLNSNTVLDYFGLSLFYDRSCNNEILKPQRQSLVVLKQMTGLEYEVIHPPPMISKDDTDQYVYHPQVSPLFLIRKQERDSPTEAKHLAVYYCLYGTIYQAPHLLDVLLCRLRNSMYHIAATFSKEVESVNGQRTQMVVAGSTSGTRNSRSSHSSTTPASEDTSRVPAASETPAWAGSVQHRRGVDSLLSQLVQEYPFPTPMQGTTHPHDTASQPHRSSGAQ